MLLCKHSLKADTHSFRSSREGKLGDSDKSSKAEAIPQVMDQTTQSVCALKAIDMLLKCQVRSFPVLSVLLCGTLRKESLL